MAAFLLVTEGAVLHHLRVTLGYRVTVLTQAVMERMLSTVLYRLALALYCRHH